MRAISRVSGGLLWANPGRLIVLVAGAISVALATSGIVLAASTNIAVVRQAVDAGWRGTYDLLVRPADSPSLSIDGQDIVPIDYLGLRTAGISREEWQRIAGFHDVDVAAPVAVLGWLKNLSPDVGVRLENPTAGTVYWIEERTVVAGEDAGRASGLFAVGVPGVSPQVHVGLRNVIGSEPVYISLGALPATWGLVVGVDPAAEDALVGLSGFVDGGYLSTGTSERFDDMFQTSGVVIPLLTAARSVIPGDLTVSVSALNGLTPEQVNAELAARPPQSVADIERIVNQLVGSSSPELVMADRAALAELLHPLVGTGITLGGDGQLTSREEEASGFGMDDNVVLVPSLAAYGKSRIASADLVLPALGLWPEVLDPQLDAVSPAGWVRPPVTFGGDATVYRDLAVTVPLPFVLQPVGTYDREAIEEQFANAANDAPLGIYAAIPRTWVRDANDQPVDEPLPVSINPAGLNPQPPVGLTNLEAVEALRGENFIDAIRVRVGGITGYTPDAVRRIETVAQQIIETTGLHVDVIAGSSPVDLRVEVPGLGVMRERWTTLGTAAAIVSGAEGLSGTLLGAAFLVVVAYLAVFGVFLTGDQAREIGILRRLGWRRRALVGLVATQAAALGLVAAALTLGLVIGLAAVSGQRVDGLLLAVAAAAVLLAHLLAAGLAGFVQLRRRHASTAPPAVRRARTSGGLFGLAMAFAGEAPGRVLVAGIATALALAVAGLVAVVELAAGGELRTTLFGQAVAVRLASYHFLAAAAALFAAGALILDGALLTVERRLSLIGALRAVGWRSGAIRRLVTVETGLPALAAGLVAGIVVGLAGLALGLGPLSVALALGVLVLAVVLAAAATQLPAGVAVQAAPAATLRAEGASGVVGGFAPRQALLTVAVLVVIVSLVAGAWGAAEGAASRPLPFVPPTQHPLSPIAIGIQADVAAIAAHPDRAPGSESFEAALVLIAEGLEATGYEVTATAYLSPQPEYLDAEGRPIEPDGVFLPALAYDAAAWDGTALEDTSSFVAATDGSLPSDCPAGIAILRIADYAELPLAQELQRRCLGETSAVLAVRAASDEVWAALATETNQIRLPVAHYMTASSGDVAETPGVPWLVVAIDSRGPGATQSAAPAAVALEVARQAAADGLALRVGIVGAGDVAAGSLFLETLTAQRAGPVVWLGPMGGPVAPILGTTSIDGFDDPAATAGLLWVAPVDDAFADWLELATSPSDQPTGEELLAALSGATRIAPGAEANLNIGPLAAGIDAAWLGEPAVVTVGPPSIAGTPADTADQIHPRDLEQLVSGILAALREIER